MEAFVGTGVALITPFKEDLSVDTNALANLVKNQIENGIEYLVVLGTTAESATLSTEEKELIKETVKTANAGKLPLVLGIGGNNTAAVTEELKTSNLDGFNAILSVSPYYNKPTQEGIYRHFKAVSEASPLPVILYNVPGRTSSNVLPETINRIARECDNIIGVKEAAGDIVQAMRLISMVPEDFMVISGDDMITLPMTLAGGKGVISVIGQGLPKEFSDMVRAGLAGKVAEAYKLHYRIAPSIDLIFAEGNPAGIKALLAKKGLVANNLRLPLVEASEALTNRIHSFMDNF
ncbi:4-hydroxy-tetrahydrodipicolinate synthase [Christiangramia gaetbulicola]|uniref:4-hydroxy-tetrahydrodipicolinate synthase n=1 Tax=Christiangramia gaetbulicola TaxID=703340 RepID=A0A2T6AIV7_9FLAO|nr:4-hydroxy-tetrahydrodipicolinate synthase [Christiangramia gaetbulicola]PTX43755.1 4-hydroxy-tetrahydrodipicolinate synthase [Christiangramia gaetbulicola]